MTKSEAKKLHFTHYETGKPCFNDHISPRYVNGSGCVQCIKEAMEIRRARKKLLANSFRKS